jgi:hypothetical protein
LAAALLTLATFCFFWLVGLGVLAALRADTSSPRIVLVAPALGAATAVLPLFFLSHAGVPVGGCAVPLAIGLLALALVALVRRRPRLPLTVLPVLLVSLLGLVLTARPMFHFGFDWIANANDDMANYVLSATQLLHHGLIAPLDVTGLRNDRDYATVVQALHTVGARPGANITLAGLAQVSGRAPYATFMPLTVALHLCGICSVGALALQAARRWWAATLAAALLALSPLATYGVLQQLLPQVMGLTLATALFALLLRPELHTAPGPRWREVVPIALLTSAFVVVYIELALALALGYVIYLGVLAFSQRLDLRALARLWLPPLAIVIVVHNTYLLRELTFVSSQAGTGLQTAAGTSPFGFALVPAALPALVGLERLAANPSSELDHAIVLAIVLLAVALVLCLLDVRRGGGASTVLLGLGLLGAALAVKASDFGLFKLYMYLQPFLAAAVAVWIARIPKLAPLSLAFLALLLAKPLLDTQKAYVEQSRNPIDLHDASDADLLPAFRRVFDTVRAPVVAVTENPTLAKLEAAGTGERPLYFVSDDMFARLLQGFRDIEPGSITRQRSELERESQWQSRSFRLLGPARRTIYFSDNTHASAVLAAGKCVVALPSGSQLPFNRRSFPEGSPDLVTPRCQAARNTLIFTSSEVGQGFYFYRRRSAVSFYQLEPDYFYPSNTFAGFGRYALFRVLDPSPTVRLELSVSTTVRHDRSRLLPPGRVVGDSSRPLPLLGRGSARVFSPPLHPQVIGGQPFVLLDLGRPGRILRVPRQGIQALWAGSVSLDPRYLSSYVRDVSLVSGAQYKALKAPASLQAFPADLANPDLEYSGIYEDGWLAETSYAVLAGGKAADLVLRADVLPAPRRLSIVVDGHELTSRRVSAGTIALRLPVPASAEKRRVELRWEGMSRLPGADGRPASALLRFVGLVSR